MKFVMTIFLMSSFTWAQNCSDLNIDLLGEVKFLQFHKDKKVKASKFFRLPASWNDNSNNFHSVVVKSDKKINKMSIKVNECLGCKFEKKQEKTFKLEYKSQKDYLVKNLKLNDYLNANFIYPGSLSFSFFQDEKLICSHSIKMEKIK